MSTIFGAAFGMFPIAWIVFSSIMLYRLAVDTGKFEIIKSSIGGLTDDRRLQAMFIAFSFGAFIEGAAGFGAPVAVSGAMLAGLGFNPFYAAGICLLANTAPVAFGSIGTPILTLANVTGLPLLALSSMTGRLCSMLSVLIPGYLMVVMVGRKKAMGVLPAIIACGVSFAGMQLFVSNYLGPELTDILSSLTCIGVMVLVLKLWKPKEIMRLEGDKPITVAATKHSGGQVFMAWLPYMLLVVAVLTFGEPEHQSQDQWLDGRFHAGLRARPTGSTSDCRRTTQSHRCARIAQHDHAGSACGEEEDALRRAVRAELADGFRYGVLPGHDCRRAMPGRGATDSSPAFTWQPSSNSRWPSSPLRRCSASPT